MFYDDDDDDIWPKRDCWRQTHVTTLDGGAHFTALPPGAENPSYATACTYLPTYVFPAYVFLRLF